MVEKYALSLFMQLHPSPALPDKDKLAYILFYRLRRLGYIKNT